MNILSETRNKIYRDHNFLDYYYNRVPDMDFISIQNKFVPPDDIKL